LLTFGLHKTRPSQSIFRPENWGYANTVYFCLQFDSASF
jgi:hypothetical protein